MKIPTGSQQPAIAQRTIDARAEEAASNAAQQKKAAKTGPARDTVEISASIDIELKKQQAEQAMRVESIKSLVKAGKYQVSSLAVAEKMLSGSSAK